MPTIVEATWVPWPLTSAIASPGTKLWRAVDLGRRGRGGSTSTPVSSTATVTPVPSYPSAQASGAPICGTLSFRLTLTRPSSQSFGHAVTAAWGSGRVGPYAGAMEFQKVRALRLGAVSAAPRMAGSRDAACGWAPWGAPAARRPSAALVYEAIIGTCGCLRRRTPSRSGR